MTAADFVRSITPYNFSDSAVVGLSSTMSQTTPLPPSVAVRVCDCASRPESLCECVCLHACAPVSKLW